MTYIIIFCLLAAAALLVVRFRKGKTPVSSQGLYLLIHDGASFVMYSAERANGCFLVDGIEYPASSCRSVEMSADVRMHIYVFSAEPIALTTHTQLMKHRAAIIKGHIFKGGGDMTRLVNMVAAGAVLACAVFVYMSVGSLNSSNASQQVILERIDKWTQSPLVVAK